MPIRRKGNSHLQAKKNRVSIHIYIGCEAVADTELTTSVSGTTSIGFQFLRGLGWQDLGMMRECVNEVSMVGLT